MATIVAELMQLKPSAITRDKSFLKDLGMDSLDFVELILAVEEEYELSIPDADAERLTTVGALADYLKSHSK